MNLCKIIEYNLLIIHANTIDRYDKKIDITFVKFIISIDRINVIKV